MANPGRVDGVVVVIAGKQIPEPSGEWSEYCRMLALEPLILEDWIEFGERIGSKLERDKIELLYQNHRRKPLFMAQAIDAFVNKE
jgi:hypothetical protein